MKKLFILAMAFGLAACATDDADVAKGGVEAGEAEVNYLTVNISSANAETRAAGDYNDYEDSYVDGTGAESTVQKLLFYFFDKNGDAAVVDFANGASYKLYTVTDDVFPDTNTKNEEETVEKIHKATIIIQTKKVNGSYVGIPDKVLVVVNPPYEEEENLSLSEVLAKVNNTVAQQNGGENFKSLISTNGFTMTNSVYVDEDNELVNAVSISEYVEPTKDQALKNPVDIYVERVVAKLTVNIGIDPVTGGVGSYDTNVFDTTKTYTDGDDEKPIYVYFEGWNVTTTTDQSRYVKAINADWTNKNDETNLFQTVTQPWNYYAFHRSYWAVNPRGVDYLFGNYSGKSVDNTASSDMVNANPATTNKSWGQDAAIYLPENAGQARGTATPWNEAKTANPTKVIIGAKLIDENGNALELAQYFGQTFISKETEGYKEVKDAILAVVTSTHKLYKEVGDEFKSIEASDVEIKTAWEAGEADEETEGRYLVYAVLTTAAKGITWYQDTPDDLTLADPTELTTWKTANAISNADNNKIVAKYLIDAGGAKVWKSGATYYYYDVRHLSEKETAPGYYGIVRNHVYNTTITGLVGLGTPVYNPDEIIIPEKPADEFGFIAARINVLAWRIVNHDVDLKWE